MAIYDLYVFDMSDIATDGPDFTQPDGLQYTLGVSTVTITPGATVQTVSVDDPNDTTFDDDDPEPQTLNGAYTVNGTSYADNTIIEAEYLMEVKDSAGTSYYIAAVSFTGDPWWIDGFTIHGPVPPFGEALTIVNTWEGFLGAVPYSSSSPACFEARTRIATPGGWTEAGRLRAGDRVTLADGGAAELALVLRQRVLLGNERDDRPVRIQAGALGPGCPERRLVVSPQHRIWVEEVQALMPARALVTQPRVGVLHGVREIDYIHLVLPRHSLILAEGCVCESFWPGKMAMESLWPRQRVLVEGAMGPDPRPCAPMLTRREAEAALEEGTAGRGLGPLPQMPASPPAQAWVSSR